MAYENMYELIHLHVSCRQLCKKDLGVLRKLFGKFNGMGLKVKELEAQFLAKNPEYAQGTKRKHDAKGVAAKVIVEGLTANTPEGYSTNKELQEKVHGQFVDFITAIEEDFTNAGFGELNGFQVDSVVIGSVVHQYFAEEKFGEGP